jgi:NAD(P)H-quinone oxidoreductase subunit 5
MAVAGVGLATVALGTLLHRAMPDAKASLAYASMTQLGVIFIEIGFGFPRLALLHIVGHAAVRTLQLLRAPSILQDYRRVHAAAGGQMGQTGGHYEHILPEAARMWLYRAALDHGFLDVFTSRFVVNPVLRLSRWLGQHEPMSKPESQETTSPTLSVKSVELP